MRLNKIHILCLILISLINGNIFAQNPPESDRSEKIVEKNSNRISREMDSLGFSLGSPVFLRIIKDIKELEIWVMQNETFGLYKKYDICTFSGGLGTKTKQWDGKSPEGFYFVRPGQLNPGSKFHLSFNIGYPNRYEQLRGYTGSAIMVHGKCVSIGCYAMGDRNIEEIWTIINAALNGGQPYFRLHVFPFHMTDEKMDYYNMEEYSGWQSFWRNLQEGYVFFEDRKVPPNVTVYDRKGDFFYFFE